MSKTVLVTGSCGFVFSNMVLYMLQHTDWNIVSVDKLTYAGSLENIAFNRDINTKRHRFYLADISDYHTMEKIFDIERPDLVINGAASSHVDNSIAGSQEFIQSNVIGTHSMLEAMRKIHVPDKFIQFSTDECYGQILNGSFKENSPLLPRNPYSASKASADLMCNSYIQTYKLPIIITRACNIFGGRQNKEKLIPKCIVNLIEDKKVPIYGQGNQVREWIFTKDVFYALQIIIEKGIAGETYNIGSGREIKNIDLVKNIINLMNKDENMIEFVEDRLGHDFRYAINCDKLKLLGWKPKYDFGEAISYTIAWYTKNRWSWS